MSDDQNTTGTGNEQTPSQPLPSGNQRLDQVLSGAARLADVARQRARQVADAAAPHMKSASTAAGRLMDERVRPGSSFDKARKMLGGTGGKTKLILIGVGILLLVIIMTGIALLIPEGPGAKSSNFGKVQTGMTEADVVKLLGASSASNKRDDGTVAETWNPEYGNDDPIVVTFANGKVTTKVSDKTVVAIDPPAEPKPEPSSAAAAVPAPAKPTTVPGAVTGTGTSEPKVVAEDVPDTFFHSAKSAAESCARTFAENFKSQYPNSEADFYDVEKTTGAEGSTIPNEYDAVVYVKTPTNAFGTRQSITVNLFYRYNPDTKQLLFIDLKQIDRGWAK